MNTVSRRKASADFHAKRKAEGWRKVTVWLDPASAFKLDAFKAAAGGTDAAIRMALEAWAGPAMARADDLTRPVSTRLDESVRMVAMESQIASGVTMRPPPPAPVFHRKAFNPQPKKGKK